MRCSLLLLLFVLFAANKTESNLSVIRASFLIANEQKTALERLKSLTQNQSTPLVKAYYGASKAIEAKYLYNPYRKLESLKSGLKIINQAADQDATELEIRYVRFAVESNIPGFISFTSHVESDKNMLIKNLNSKHGHYQTIKSYLMKSNKVSESDKKKIQWLLPRGIIFGDIGTRIWAIEPIVIRALFILKVT